MSEPAVNRPGPRGEIELIRRYLRLVMRHKWWVLGVWVAMAVTATVLAYALPNVYQSSTMILVERQKVPEEYVRSTVTENMQERLKTISQQILSRTQVRQVVEEYDIASDPSTLALALQRLHLYDTAPVQKLRVWLRTKTEQDRMARTEQLITDFQKKVEVKVVGRQAFSVAYEGHDPIKVMRVTNAMAGMFISENLRIREVLAEGTTEFLEAQLEIARQELEAQEAEVQAFKSRHMGALPSQLPVNLNTLDRMQLELQHVDASLASLAMQRSFAERQLSSLQRKYSELSLEELQALRDSPALVDQLAASEAMLAQLKVQYTDEHPEVILMQAQVDEIRRMLEEADTDRDASASLTVGGTETTDAAARLHQIGVEMEELRLRRKQLQKDVALYQKRVENTPRVEQDLQKLQRDYRIMQENYQNLLAKRNNAALSESLERRQKGEQFRVIDPANLPTLPVRPHRILILFLGLVGGLGVGIGLVVGADLIRPRFHAVEDVHEVLGLPVLAAVPKIGK